MDYNKIKEAAQGYEGQMTKFLRDLVRIPGESADEKGHIDRIAEEMRAVGFDKVDIDPMGNVLGYMGTGKTLIGYDAHIDTVGVGNRDNWEFDPYEGFESDTEIGGRGTSDQLGGIVSAVYGAKIMKDLGMLNDKYRVVVTGTVQEEDCDGLCWQYIINEGKVRPEFVVSTEPTDGGIYRGQRGRMGRAGAVSAGCLRRPKRGCRLPAGRIFGRRPALGQPAVQLGCTLKDRVRLVDTTAAPCKRRIRCGPYRPLSRL